VWLRANGNVARRESGALWGRGVDVGSWWRWRRAQLTASVLRESAAGQLFLGPGRGAVVGVVPVRYTEGALTLRVDGDETSFAAGAELRRDPDAERLYEPGLSASAVFGRNATNAVVITAARQLPDFIRGADAQYSLTIALQFRRPPALAARGSPARPTIQVGGADATRTVVVRAAGARRVEVMADFTGWEPLELTPDGDAFSRNVVLAPGTHRVVVRIDGGAWMPAANTPAIDDDLGGRVGLLVVP
jgi:hypothetical protein